MEPYKPGLMLDSGKTCALKTVEVFNASTSRYVPFRPASVCPTRNAISSGSADTVYTLVLFMPDRESVRSTCLIKSRRCVKAPLSNDCLDLYHRRNIRLHRRMLQHLQRKTRDCEWDDAGKIPRVAFPLQSATFHIMMIREVSLFQKNWKMSMLKTSRSLTRGRFECRKFIRSELRPLRPGEGRGYQLLPAHQLSPGSAPLFNATTTQFTTPSPL